MSQEPQASPNNLLPVYLRSPSILFSLLLIAVYLLIGTLGGDLVNPPLPLALVQCNSLLSYFPWTLVTSIFLHAGILHLATNIVFLIFFGWVLEEQVDKTRWITAFFITGLAGNLTFYASSLALGDACGVGASGAVYGIMGAATGPRVVILIIFIAGLDIFAGGGFFAHIGGLIVGLLLRSAWAAEKQMAAE